MELSNILELQGLEVEQEAQQEVPHSSISINC